MVPLVGLTEFCPKVLMISLVGLAYICTKMNRCMIYKHNTRDMTYDMHVSLSYMQSMLSPILCHVQINACAVPQQCSVYSGHGL